jgi:hypothetical protein
MRVLRQTIDNLDAQRDQLMAAIERDHLAGTLENNQIHHDLLFTFTEIGKAREHLVDAHNLLRDVVEPLHPTGATAMSTDHSIIGKHWIGKRVQRHNDLFIDQDPSFVVARTRPAKDESHELWLEDDGATIGAYSDEVECL